jgi:hypothetical protein
LTVIEASAKDPDLKSANKGAPARDKAQTEPVAIPECLEALKISQSQQDQVHDVVRKYDAALAAAWKQFSERYMETIKTRTSPRKQSEGRSPLPAGWGRCDRLRPLATGHLGFNR